MQYMAHDTDNIEIQRFCDDQYIVRQSNKSNQWMQHNREKVKCWISIFIHGPNFSFSVTLLWFVNFHSSSSHSCDERHLEEQWSSDGGRREICWESLTLSIKISIFGGIESILVSHKDGRRYISLAMFCPTPMCKNKALLSCWVGKQKHDPAEL